jgi:hypothetical protein
MYLKKKSIVSHSVGMRVSIACIDDDARQNALARREGGEKENKNTHHLTELDGRLAHLIPNPNRDLRCKLVNCTSRLKARRKSHHAHNHVALRKGHHLQRCGCGRCGEYINCQRGDSRTSLSIFTLALSPSMASSFWPSRSSAKRVPARAAVSDEAS